MAVYKRAYRPYTGALTPAWSRFLILPRCSLGRLFRSKIMMIYTVLCFVPALIALLLIYLTNSSVARLAMGMRPGQALPFEIDGRFFYYLLNIQGGMAFLLTAWVGPTLVSPDLTNNALPLYLSRPFSKPEYVVGKMVILAGIMSCTMWLSDLILFFVQASLAADGWLASHWFIAWAIFAGSLIWIVVLSLLALAMSAWVKWRLAASGAMVGIFFVAAGFGEAFNAVLRTYWGRLINLYYLVRVVWQDLFDMPLVTRTARFRVGDPTADDIPVGIAWLALFAICGFCLVLLNRRLQAKEVVRG